MVFKLSNRWWFQKFAWSVATNVLGQLYLSRIYPVPNDSHVHVPRTAIGAFDTSSVTIATQHIIVPASCVENMAARDAAHSLSMLESALAYGARVCFLKEDRWRRRRRRWFGNRSGSRGWYSLRLGSTVGASSISLPVSNFLAQAHRISKVAERVVCGWGRQRRNAVGWSCTE